MQEDTVLAEVNVFLSQSLSPTLHLIQYPLRPAHLPLESDNVQTVRVRSENNQVHMKLAIHCHGENYSRSKGEGYARDVDMAPSSTKPAYQSGLMDCYSLTSDPQSPLGHRYVAGVLRDGELHLCPLKDIVQLRPNLHHLDQATAGRKKSVATADANTDNDTTESEGEEAKPVTVRFARRDTGSNRSKRVSWSEYSNKKLNEDGWVEVKFNSITSELACNERELLFTSEHLTIHNDSLSPSEYLDKLCPIEDRHIERVPSEPPGGAVSLSKLKELSLPRQVHDLLMSTGILTFNQLISLLQCGRGQLPAYLDALGQYGVLVQGCWVISSHLLYPGDTQTTLCNARDYLLCCFNQTRCIGRKDVAVLTKVPHETVRQILAPLTSGLGLEFKIPTDNDFIHKYPHIVRQQNEKWKKRLEQLRAVLCLPKEQHKSPVASDDSHKSVSKRMKMASIKIEPTEDHTSQQPQSQDTAIVKQECNSILEWVEKFCNEVLIRGVHSLTDITNRLRVHQGTLDRGHPLGTAVITESLLEEALIRVGAIETGQASGIKLFALLRNHTEIDRFRSVVLKLFQNHRWLRRKMLLETMESECGHQPDPRDLTTIMKEVAYSRGSQWYLLGT